MARSTKSTKTGWNGLNSFVLPLWHWLRRQYGSGFGSHFRASVAATLIGGYPIFKEAVENIVERKMTMELSMTIALVSALAIGEFFTALVITGFVLAAEVLEGLTVGRGRRAIQDLLDFLPDINDANLHVKTLSGPVTLNDVRDSHIDIHSVSGNVNIHNVSGSSLEVNSGSGRITYDGDPGTAGEYLLTSHSGDLEVSIPANALVEIKAHSLKGESDPGFLGTANVPAAGQRSLLVKPGIVSASRFVQRSFRGKIHLKRP